MSSLLIGENTFPVTFFETRKRPLKKKDEEDMRDTETDNDSELYYKRRPVQHHMTAVEKCELQSRYE